MHVKFPLIRLRPVAAAAVVLAVALTSPPAGAVSEVAGATFPEQIVQEVTLIEQQEQAVLQTEQQIGMLASQTENLGTMPIQFWAQLTGPVMRMQQIVSNAEGISASVENTAAATVQEYGDPTGSVGYAGGTLAEWTQGLNQQIGNVLRQYGYSERDFATADATNQTLQTASQTAQGRNKILQASNAVGGVLENELHELDTDTRAANTAILTDIGNRANDKVQKQKTSENWLSAPPLKPPY